MTYQVGRINGPALADNLTREGVGADTFLFETDLLIIDGGNSLISTTGNLLTSASTTNRAGINIPPGIAPTSPNDGDIWVTASGLNVQIGGGTVLSGDVFATGTPLNNQIAHWTDGNTIDGDSTLTWSGTVLDITGSITLSGTVDGIDIATDVAANTSKVTNATHTGQVTGETALALGITAVTDQPAAGTVIGADTLIINDGGVLSEVTATQLATFTNATAGDVTKVSTPVDNEIGVWTGDGTLEGDTNLTWDGTVLNITGEVAISAELQIEAFSENAVSYSIDTGTKVLDTSAATYFYGAATMTAVAYTFQFDSPAASGRVTTITIEMLNAAAASSITWPATVTWDEDTEPTWGAGDSFVSFTTRDNGAIWRGFPGGLNH